MALNMENMNDLRNKLNSIDEQILKLFENRMDIVSLVAKYKTENNLPVFDKSREEEVIIKAVGLLKNPQLSEYASEFFKSLMSVSKKYQQDIISSSDLPVVAYQGLPGAYSEEALKIFFKDRAQALPKKTFEEVFLEVANGNAKYGVIPVENSVSGGIDDTLNLMERYHLYISGEVLLPVKHCLISVKGATLENIDEVFSHEQGFIQCRDFLSNYPDLTLTPHFNTAISASHIAKMNNPKKAAIASEYAAKIYGLDILKYNTGNNDKNSTRFLIITKDFLKIENADKISICFILNHKSGQLSKALTVLSDNGLNLLRIESRPVVDSPFEYRFYVDFEGSLKDQNVITSIEAFNKYCREYRLLGNFRRWK
jgi:chorismate mutase / prephenate dehydratase